MHVSYWWLQMGSGNRLRIAECQRGTWGLSPLYEIQIWKSVVKRTKSRKKATKRERSRWDFFPFITCLNMVFFFTPLQLHPLKTVCRTRACSKSHEILICVMWKRPLLSLMCYHSIIFIYATDMCICQILLVTIAS